MSQEPQNDERGSQLFSEAMRAMESGSMGRAEQLFIGALSNLPPSHHLTILALKTLVTISSNKGDLEKAIDWSLQLLDSQTAALGYSHADTARTVLNISTMCETLGKHDLAKEVKELHQYASHAERSVREQKLKGLRVKNEIAEPEDTTQDEQHKSAIELIVAGIEEVRKMAAHPAVTVAICVILMALPFIAFVALKYTYSNEKQNALVANNDEQFISPDDRLSFKFISAKYMIMSIDGEERKLPFDAYGYSGMELGDIMLSNPTEKQYWLMFSRDGLADGSGRLFYHRDHPDSDVIKQVVNIASTCGMFYKRNKFYPDSLSEIGDFSYKNTYTLRRDYPIVQIVSVPGEAEVEPFVNALINGALWPNEAVMYPGCINCAHISSKTNMSVPDTFLIHGCNGRGQLFTQSDGRPLIYALQKGKQVSPRLTRLTELQNVTRICLLDIHPAWAGLVLTLINSRYLCLWVLLGICFYFAAKFFRDERTHKIMVTFMFLNFLLAIVSLFLPK